MSLTKLTSCGHCYNIARMDIVGTVSNDITDRKTAPEYIMDVSVEYTVAICPACKKENIFSYIWTEHMEDENDITYEVLYPSNTKLPLGLPPKILSAYKAADKIKTIDVNAYAILMRRMLEMVCLERNAEKGNLYAMLKDLAKKREIPDKLVKVAMGLKDLGNLGAHAAEGELSEDEIPILQALSIAILEYIYSAPHLANLAEKKLNAIKSKGTK